MKHVTADPVHIATDAREVAAQDQQHQEAETDEVDAYVQLLTAVLAAAEPACEALSGVVPDHDMRGLLLVRTDDASIWWLDDGSLVRVEGHIASPIDVFTLVDGYGRYAAVDAIMAISIAIDAQLRGGKMQATARIHRRADQIRALATLARGIS